MSRRARRIAFVLLLAPGLLAAQGSPRRLTTIDALKQYPGYYHLQNVMLRGELIEDARRPLLRSDDRELPVLIEGVQTTSGPVEVRAQVIDVGRLEPGDPRVGKYGEGRNASDWPRPGEELLLKLTSVAEAQPGTTPSVRALALEPWKFDGQMVTVAGNFRGRNLFGDLPDSPGRGRYDFVLRGAEGAVWVGGLRPRGKGFDLDVDRRLDTDKWLDVTGMVTRTRGLVMITATKIELAKTPETLNSEEAAPPPPPPPAEVVFSSPTGGETDVSPGAPVRIQFSRGLRDATLPGKIRVTYAGAAPDAPGPEFKTAYDAATRALEIRFASPLQPFRTVKVEVLEGLAAFDGGPVVPWTVTFTLGAR